MKKASLKSFIFLMICLSSLPTLANHNLLSLYQMAQAHDPTIKAAQATLEVSLQAKPQAMAQFLPVINGAVTTTANRSGNPLVESYNSNSYTATISQPIFRLSDWLGFQQASAEIRQAQAVYLFEEQDLIFRLTSAYLNILRAQDELNLSKGQRKAFARHLEQTQQRFNVGLIAITDVHEAKARHDSAYAQEIAAENALSNVYENMYDIVGEPVKALAPLKSVIKLEKPVPAEAEHWVNLALSSNANLLAAEAAMDVAKKQYHTSIINHVPTVVADGSVSRVKGVLSPTQNRHSLNKVGITVSIPLFSGGRLLSQTKQAAHNLERAKENLIAEKRATQTTARQAYRGVITQISQVKAFKQVVQSNKSALKATEAAFDVGTRTIVDVLNAQSELLEAEKDYSVARYDYLLERLKLKQASGTLTGEDILMINQHLKT